MRVVRRTFQAGTMVVLAACAVMSCDVPPPQQTAREPILRYRMDAPPPNLDPVRANDNNSLFYIYQIFDGLVEFAPGTLDVQAAVAASWTISQDGKVYTFKLKEGLTFHNGMPVTADDVVYSLRRGLTKSTQSQKRDFLAPLDGSGPFWDGETGKLPGAAAPDSGTVVLTLTEPSPQFLTVLATEAGSIVPRRVYEDPEQTYLRQPVGCGPFTMASFEPDIAITLARFNDHWKTRPNDGGLDAIRVRFIRDASTALEEYRTGGIDFTYELPPGQRAQIQTEMPAHFHHGKQLWIMYLAFNHHAGPFAGNPTLRRAIAHAIDTDYIVRNLQEGKDWVATGVIPPGMPGHVEGEAPWRYDVARARALMVEAGYPEGRGLPPIDYLTNETQGFRRILDRLTSDLGAIGVKLNPREMDFGAFLGELTAQGGPRAPLWRMTWFADWPDPDNFLGLQFFTGAAGNYARYSNPVFDDLVARARRETDPAVRADLFRQADRVLMDDVALVPIYWYGSDILLRPEFAGWKHSPLGPYAIAWEEVYLDRDGSSG